MQRTLGLSPAAQGRLLATLVAVLAFWALRRVILAAVYRRVADPHQRYRWEKTITYTLGPIALLVVGRIWFEGFESWATFLGLLSAGLAVALRDPLVNLAAWAFILWRRPFDVGDRVQIGPHTGDVIDQRLFQFSLLEIGNWVDADQSTGRIIHVPNGLVFSAPLANYTQAFEFIWNELPVLVTFESNWEQAKGILAGIAEHHATRWSQEAEAQILRISRKFMIPAASLTPSVFTSVADSGVTLTIRYPCPPRERRTTAQAIWEDVLRAFAGREDIDFAYPTQRFYDNALEGKPQARATPPAP